MSYIIEAHITTVLGIFQWSVAITFTNLSRFFKYVLREVLPPPRY